MAKIFKIGPKQKADRKPDDPIDDDLVELDSYISNVESDFANVPQPKPERLKYLYRRLEECNSNISNAKYFGGKIKRGNETIPIEKLIEERNIIVQEIQAVNTQE